MKNHWTKLAAFGIAFLMLFSLFAPAATRVRAEGEDEAVENVKTLLEGIDSLAEMQYYRVTVTREAGLTSGYRYYDNPNYTQAHLDAQAAYRTYLDDMFAKRAAAKEAYEALTDEQKAAIAADETAAANLAKLTPYDKLPTKIPLLKEDLIVDTIKGDQLDYPVPVDPVTDPDDPYVFEYLRGYELSFSFADEGWPSNLVMVDASKDGITGWTPDGIYDYGSSNYEVVYCCDAEVLPVKRWQYKRVNLEDATYYSEEAASHIRAILQNSYPYATIEEMKEWLVANGYNAEYAAALTRSDIIASVQFAIWNHSNYNYDTNYLGTGIMEEQRDRRDYLAMTSTHDYRNEIWDWYVICPKNYYVGYYSYTYYPEIEARINSLTQFLTNLPGVQPSDDQIVITDVTIARTALVPGTSDTYQVDLNIFLNHGAASANDNVSIKVTSEQEAGVNGTETVDVSGKTVYQVSIIAKYGDTVTVSVDGTQNLAKGVYFYEPKGGYDKSQPLVGVAEGSTRIHAEDSFTFEQDVEMGLRVYKTAEGTGYPISDISFDIYRAVPDEGEQLPAKPSEEDVARYAVADNLVATITTDDTGYAFTALDRGSYLVVERLNAEKVKAVADPFFITLPSPVTADDGTIVYEDVVSQYIENTPVDKPGTVSLKPEVTKAFEDWGKADAFRFELAAVTEGAPLPAETVVTATEDDPTAVYGSIIFKEPGTYQYTITELNDHADGVTYDTSAHAVTVTVTKDDETGELAASITYDGAESLTVTNTYEPTAATIEVTKELVGRDWIDTDSFTFLLTAVTEGAPMPEVTEATATKDEQTVSFGEITYEKSGVYRYTIKEVYGSNSGITYDTEPHAVTVTVTKDADTNELSAAVIYDDDAPSLKVINIYEAEPVSVVFGVRKNIEGEPEDTLTFDFDLTETTDGEAGIESISIEGEGSEWFFPLTFIDPGVYTFEISESIGSAAGWTYDSRVYSITVTVTDDGLGHLQAEVDGPDENIAEFTNTYVPETTPEETTPEETTPEETTPEETTPEETTPEETTPEETTPAETTPEETTPEETTPEETTPEETTPEETTPEETTPEETTPEETTPEETTPEETTVPATTTPAPTTTPATPPPTGDEGGILLFVLLLMASSTALAAILSRRRRA